MCTIIFKLLLKLANKKSALEQPVYHTCTVLTPLQKNKQQQQKQKQKQQKQSKPKPKKHNITPWFVVFIIIYICVAI